MKISLFGVSFEIDLTDHDRRAYERLLKKLANRRVLNEPEDSEWVGEVVKSIQVIRSDVADALNEVGESSKIVEPLLALQAATHRFLTKVKSISEQLKHNVALSKQNKEAGVQLQQDQEELIRHYNIFGPPDLMENTQLNLSHVKPVGYQIAFAEALGRFRGEVASMLSVLCSLTTTSLPGPLVALAPRPESQSAASDIGT